jgi:uncharacterized membrane protein YccC
MSDLENELRSWLNNRNVERTLAPPAEGLTRSSVTDDLEANLERLTKICEGIARATINIQQRQELQSEHAKQIRVWAQRIHDQLALLTQLPRAIQKKTPAKKPKKKARHK